MTMGSPNRLYGNGTTSLIGRRKLRIIATRIEAARVERVCNCKFYPS
jgi:hypothetical protein